MHTGERVSKQARERGGVRDRQTERGIDRETVCLFVGCLTSQQHASVSQGRICSDNFTCCHTEIEVANQTFHLTRSQFTDTWQTSPSANPIMPGAWQSSHWGANFLSHWYDSTPKKSRRNRDSNPGSSSLEVEALPLGQRGGQRDRQTGRQIDGRTGRQAYGQTSRQWGRDKKREWTGGMLTSSSMWWFRWLDPLSRECRILGCQEQILCRPPKLGFEGHTSRPCLLPCLPMEWAGL